MFVLYSFFASILISGVDFLFFKTFQLENYKIKNYLRNTFNFNFSMGSKNKLKITKRIKRLMCVVFLFNSVVFLVAFAFLPNFLSKMLFLLSFLLLCPWLVVVPFVFAKPIENSIQKIYIRKAKKKLSACKCKKIGITGSFGKTSTKNILYQILKEEFDVCSTPKSFNTPMGVCKSVLEDLKETDDFFIVEMGARHLGDIKFLAKFVGVDFGIITPIGNCHLETFGNIENIEKTKYELCENSKFVVFNGTSNSSKKLFEKFERKKYLVCQDGSFAYARNIKTNENGSKFLMCIDGKELVCETQLFGKANIDNIVVASSMAYLLGESLMCIKNAIKKIKSTPHRMQLIRSHINIIDDSYNSNFDGFLEALSVLKLFSGRKIVVSPGIVELGKLQKETNFKIGVEIGKTCDVFVIMNQTNKNELSAGAKKGGLLSEKIFYANTREEQQKILKNIIRKGDCVLFENDFPDNIK